MGNTSSQQTITWRNGTRVYTNTGNTLTHLTINTVERNRLIAPGINFPTQTTYKEDYSFEYNNHYPNKTDFNNAVVLGEFGVLFNQNYLLNKAYTNIPDKITYVETNSSNPATISNYTTSTTYGYNPLGLISSSLTSKNKTGYIYNY